MLLFEYIHVQALGISSKLQKSSSYMVSHYRRDGLIKNVVKFWGLNDLILMI